MITIRTVRLLGVFKKMKSESFPIIKDNEVHIWSVNLSNYQCDLNYFWSLLVQSEREQAESYRFQRDQCRYVVARGVLRSLLSKYLKQAPETIKITYETWGKPTLTITDRVYFNLSHSADYILYALTKDYEVGIDIEYKDENIKFEDIVFDIFSAPELEQWRRLANEDRSDFFYKHWVCKEAILKAFGKGWLEGDKEVSLNKIYTNERSLKDQCYLKEKIGYPYYFECIPGYASALYINGPLLCPVYYSWGQIYK